MKLHAAAFALATALFGASNAQAASIPNMEIDKLQLDTTGAGSLVVGDGEVLGAGQGKFSVALASQYAPLVLKTDGTLRGRGVGASGSTKGQYIGPRATAIVTAVVAPVEGLELSIRVPYVLTQSGTNLTASGFPKPASSGLGQSAVGLRLGVVKQGDSPVSVAVAADFLPADVGSPEAVAGNTAFAATPRVEVGRRFEKFLVAADLRATFRENQAKLGNETWGNEYGGSVAVSTLGPIRGEAAFRASFNEGKLGQSYEALVGLRYARGPVELFALGGPGFGEAPGTPTYRGVLGLSYGPAAK